MKNDLLNRLLGRAAKCNDVKNSLSLRVGKQALSLTMALGLSVLFSCKEDTPDPVPPKPEPPITSPTITVTPTTEHQEMVGFGGALTWYSDRVISNPKREEIYQLMFEDLGMDILRLKNWYYPLDYPANKSPEVMLTTGDKVMFEATNAFYAKAKEYNPSMRVLLSSWGPPPALKSNNHLREGTLKKNENGEYMYEAYATYWSDILDNIAFDPDYISIQNEPGYVNSGWTTCKWAPMETAALAGYESAFVQVHEKIKDRSDAPVMLGTEAENLQAFMNFAPVVKDKTYCPIYAYHPYNFNNSTDISQITTLLNGLRANFGNKPNFMTEYSGMTWFKTARLIHRTMKHANTSAYIYWELVWGDANNKEQAMIYVDNASYSLSPMYYVMKHFAKYIDEGYKRVEVSASISALEVTGYMKPDQSQLTLVIINPNAQAAEYALEVAGKTIKGVKAYQTVEGSYFKELGSLQPTAKLQVPATSITTVVLDL